MAEFAPAAQRTVTPPPTTGLPDSPGAGRRARATTTTATAPTSTALPTGSAESAVPTSVASRSRSCVGSPPRQTADPQSPPCLATIFEGDNGGISSAGVTGTEIRIAVGAAAPTGRSFYTALFEYFNQHYEFYGRRLIPAFTGEPPTASPSAARAAAASIASQSVFAALPGFYMPHATFFHELARQRVISVFPHGGTLLEDRSLLDALHPYAWSVFPSAEQLARNAASFICTSLAGRSARFAGSSLAGNTRQFAVIATGPTTPAWTTPIRDALAACDIVPSVVELTDSSTSDQRRVALARLQAEGVTSIVCLCHVNGALDLNNLAANSVGFRPEWIQLTRSSYDELFSVFFTKGAPQLSQVIELSPSEKVLPMQARPSFLALLEIDPTYPNAAMYQEDARVLYRELAVLAAGIQGAGPQLTPDTFAAGLMSMQFPNAGAGQGPYWQPSVGFGPGDHSFYDDYAIARWDMSLTPYDTGATVDGGSWCYFERGARFRPGTYPADYVDRVLAQPVEACR